MFQFSLQSHLASFPLLEPSDLEVPAISRSRLYKPQCPSSSPALSAYPSLTTTATTGYVSDASLSPSPMTIKLEAMLESVRSRNLSKKSEVAGEPNTIKLPTLPTNIISIPVISTGSSSMPSSPLPVASFPSPAAAGVVAAVASAPCSPILSPSPIYISSSEDSDSDSDSDSDAGSTISSTSSSRSAESFTSVSSSSSIPSQQQEKPFYPRLPQSSLRTFPVPLSNDLQVTSIEPMDSDSDSEEDKPLHPSQLQLLPRTIHPQTQRKRIITPPTPHRPSKSTKSTPEDRKTAPVTKYLYQGGQTGVVTGGVMLGAAAAAAAPTRSSNKGSSPSKSNSSAFASAANLRSNYNARDDKPWMPPTGTKSLSPKASMPLTGSWRRNGNGGGKRDNTPPRPLLGPESGDWRVKGRV